MTSKWISLICLSVIMSFPARSVDSCTCAKIHEDALLMVARYDLVFAGRVINITDSWIGRDTVSAGDPIQYLFQIDRVWKGSVVDTVTICSSHGGGSCGYVFEANENYLVFANPWQGAMRTSICTPTSPVSGSRSLITALDHVPVRGSAEDVDRAIVQKFIVETNAPAESIRTAAAEALGSIKKCPEVSVPALRNLYRHGKSKDRAAAMYALATSFETENAVTILKDAFKDNSPDVRLYSLYGLNRISKGRPWTTECRAALHDPSPLVRSFAMWSAKDQNLAGYEVVPYLVSAINDTAEEIRATAAGVMEKYPECGEPCLRALEKASRDSVINVRSAAILSLIALGDQETVQNAVLLGGTDRDSDLRRSTIMNALNHYEGTLEAIPVFIRGLQDTSRTIRYETLSRLEWSTRGHASQALALSVEMRPKLLSAIVINAEKEADVAICELALRTLDRLGAVRENEGVFRRAIDSDSEFIQNTARRALERAGIDPAAGER